MRVMGQWFRKREKVRNREIFGIRGLETERKRVIWVYSIRERDCGLGFYI